MANLTDSKSRPSGNPCRKADENGTEYGTMLESYIDGMLNHLDASEITFTFRDKFIQQFQDVDEIITLISRYFRNLPLNTIREVLLVAEYGETNRIHFHGVIRASAHDKASLLMWLKKRFGRATITAVRDTEKYKKYILKEHPEDFIYRRYI